jgi:hypothetical protein
MPSKTEPGGYELWVGCPYCDGAVRVVPHWIEAVEELRVEKRKREVEEFGCSCGGKSDEG